jgi:hypothetical protein
MPFVVPVVNTALDVVELYPEASREAPCCLAHSRLQYQPGFPIQPAPTNKQTVTDWQTTARLPTRSAAAHPPLRTRATRTERHTPATLDHTLAVRRSPRLPSRAAPHAARFRNSRAGAYAAALRPRARVLCEHPHAGNQSAMGGREQTAGSGHDQEQIPALPAGCGELCHGSWGWGPPLTCPQLRSLSNFEPWRSPPPARGALVASRPACAGRPQKTQNWPAALSSALNPPPAGRAERSPARLAPAPASELTDTFPGESARGPQNGSA